MSYAGNEWPFGVTKKAHGFEAGNNTYIVKAIPVHLAEKLRRLDDPTRWGNGWTMEKHRFLMIEKHMDRNIQQTLETNKHQ